MAQAIEHVLASQNKLGEGPVWDTEEQALYWVDIENSRFCRLQPASGAFETVDVGVPVGVLALRERGGLVMATKAGFAFWNRQNGLRLLVNPQAQNGHTRFNDGAVDCRGRFWAGTMCGLVETCQEPEGSLYRLDPDGSLHIMETGVFVSNGIDWSPDNTLMYYTDSPTKTIFVYDFDAQSGTIANRRPFIHTPDESGVPDGLAVDSEGCLWSARWGGGKITRYDPTGQAMQELRLPVQYPTSCAFGGASLDELYITSAWTALSPEKREQQPLAGDLFLVRAGVRGQTQRRFAG